MDTIGKVIPRLLEYSENRFVESVRFAEANDVELGMDGLLTLLRETHGEIISFLRETIKEKSKNE